MTNTQHYWNQVHKLSSEITVLVCVTTFEGFGSSSENFL